ncbi:hypothetical protein B0H13DRAFT_1877783 [Mycena leptocephala]|nr:hypothetical protein B0H13DRAFT_1877783 [Mycena leptocephala]
MANASRINPIPIAPPSPRCEEQHLSLCITSSSQLPTSRERPPAVKQRQRKRRAEHPEKRRQGGGAQAGRISGGTAGSVVVKPDSFEAEKGAYGGPNREGCNTDADGCQAGQRMRATVTPGFQGIARKGPRGEGKPGERAGEGEEEHDGNMTSLGGRRQTIIDGRRKRGERPTCSGLWRKKVK